MFRKSLFLACTALTLVCAAGARADSLTTQVTLVGPYGTGVGAPAGNVPTLVNAAGGLGAGLSYTVAQSPLGSFGTPVYATGAENLGTFKLFSGATGSFQTASIIETYAIQGTQVTPAGGALFTAAFTKGVVAFYAVAPLSFNPNLVSTWGTGQGGPAGTFLGSYALSPVQAIGKGPLGDPSFAGQPTTGQNQASFFPASGQQALGALVVNILNNPGNFLAPPQTFTGLQGEISEVNALSGPGNGGYAGDTNTNLDANFSFLAGLDPGQGFTTGQFTALNYTGNVNAFGPDTLQEISITNYPIQTSSTGIPEPASMLLWGGIAAGFGIYRRVRRNRVKNV